MRRGDTQQKRLNRVWLLLAGLLVGFGSQSVEAQTFNLTQITNTTGGASLNLFPSINADGTRIAFQSNRDLRPGSPGNADGNVEIFLFDTTTNTFTQITNTTGCGNGSPSINAAGTRIAFESTCNLTPGSPGNADGGDEIFLFDTTTGTFTQITNTTLFGFNFFPAINAAGTRIVFISTHNLTPGLPGNADGNIEVFFFDTTTGTFTQITNSTGFNQMLFPTINAAGTRIAFLSNSDLKPGSPGNADGSSEVFLFDTTTNTLTQVTNTTGGAFGNDEPMINAAGTRIVFVSDRDLTPGSPGNADGNAEIFVFNIATSTFTQITNTTGGGGGDNPSINADGTRIAFVRTVAGSRNILLVDTTTGIFTQITNAPGAGGSDEPSINADGTRIAFQSPRDLTPGNPGNADGNIELFLAIQAGPPPPPPPGATAVPTLSEWAELVMIAVLVLGGLFALHRRRSLVP
jgi:Tol biopolymer transport system component